MIVKQTAIHIHNSEWLTTTLNQEYSSLGVKVVAYELRLHKQVPKITIQSLVKLSRVAQLVEHVKTVSCYCEIDSNYYFP